MQTDPDWPAARVSDPRIRAVLGLIGSLGPAR